MPKLDEVGRWHADVTITWRCFASGSTAGAPFFAKRRVGDGIRRNDFVGSALTESRYRQNRSLALALMTIFRFLLKSNFVVVTIRLAGEIGRGEWKGKAMRSTHFVASCAVASCLSLASTTMAQATGACCIDPNADRGFVVFCVLVTEAQCAGFQVNPDFRGDGSDCTVCFGGGGGACCLIPDGFISCVGVADELACQNLTFAPPNDEGVYQGDGTSCIPTQTFNNDCPPPPPPDMPAVSQWGVATLVLLILAGITIKFTTMRKRA